MVDYAAIKAEVIGDQKYAAAYAAKDVNTLREIYNTVTELGKVDLGTLDAYLKSVYDSAGTLQVYWSLKSYAAGSVQPQAQLAQMILDLFTSRLNSLDFSLPVTSSNLDKCISAGILSAQNKTDLIALATQPRNISIEDLAFALYNPDGSVK